MRLRYFFITFSIVSFLSLLTTFLNQWFLSRERLNLVNQSLRDAATALIDSDISNLRQIDFDKADNIISDELGDSRIGKFFIIRNNKEDILYQSASAKLLNMSDAPRSPQWITLKKNGKSFRILNLNLPRIPDKTLQVGAVFNDQIIQPSYLTYNSLIFFLMIILCGSLTAYILTSTLLKPILSLSSYVQQVTVSITRHTDLPIIPDNLKQFFKSKSGTKDEFASLVKGFNLLVDTINRNHKMTRQWTYQLAHELKTPIAILEFEHEKITSNYKIQQIDSQNLKVEIAKLNDIISSFLSWAELENSNKQKNLNGINVSKVLKDLSVRLNRSFSDRVKLDVKNDLFVLCSPHHFEQAFLNLVQNALFYSPENEDVTIEVESNKISIKDNGPGIPEKISQRIGEPFNRGNESKKGHGLGLAWVYSVAKLYQWEIHLKSSKSGTTFLISFLSEDA